MQVQIVPEFLHFQLHELCLHQKVAIETLTGVTEVRASLTLDTAAAAVVLFTVHTNMLTERQVVKKTGCKFIFTSHRKKIQNICFALNTHKPVRRKAVSARDYNSNTVVQTHSQVEVLKTEPHSSKLDLYAQTLFTAINI